MNSDPNIVRLAALTAFHAKHFEEALEHLDTLVAATDDAWDYRWRGLTLLRLGKYAEAYQTFELMHARCPQDPKSLPIMALIKASCPDDSIRDSQTALELARRIRESEHSGDWSNLSVLAAVFAEAKDFHEAIRYIDAAIQLAPATLTERFMQRRQQYRNQEPYRLPTDGFDGLVPAGKCEACGAEAFCSDGLPGTTHTILCLPCARKRFASDSH